MNSESHADIESVFELAGLEIEHDAIASLVREISTIIDFISQIGEAESSSSSSGEQPPALENSVRLRLDLPEEIPGIADPSEFAPSFHGGFFTVPRLKPMDEG